MEGRFIRLRGSHNHVPNFAPDTFIASEKKIEEKSLAAVSVGCDWKM